MSGTSSRVLAVVLSSYDSLVVFVVLVNILCTLVATGTGGAGRGGTIHIPSEHFRAAIAAASRASKMPDMIASMRPIGASTTRPRAGIYLPGGEINGTGGVSFRFTQAYSISRYS